MTHYSSHVNSELEVLRNKRLTKSIWTENVTNNNASLQKLRNDTKRELLSLSLISQHECASSSQCGKKPHSFVSKVLTSIEENKCIEDEKESSANRNLRKIKEEVEKELEILKNNNKSENKRRTLDHIHYSNQNGNHVTRRFPSVSLICASIEAKTPQKVVSSFDEYLVIQKSESLQEKRKQEDAQSYMHHYNGRAAMYSTIFNTLALYMNSNDGRKGTKDLTEQDMYIHKAANRAAAAKSMKTLTNYTGDSTSCTDTNNIMFQSRYGQVFIFVVHVRLGLGLFWCKRHKMCADENRYQIVGGPIEEKEFQCSEKNDDYSDEERLLFASKLAAGRHLYEQVGIDTRSNLDRLASPKDVGLEIGTVDGKFNVQKELYFIFVASDSDFPYSFQSDDYDSKMHTGIFFEQNIEQVMCKICVKRDDIDSIVSSLDCSNYVINEKTSRKKDKVSKRKKVSSTQNEPSFNDGDNIVECRCDNIAECRCENSYDSRDSIDQQQERIMLLVDEMTYDDDQSSDNSSSSDLLPPPKRQHIFSCLFFC